MAVYKKRSRIISFRLSEDDYEKLWKTGSLKGARSPCDYARSALREHILNTDGVEQLTASSEIQVLKKRIDEIDRNLMQLSRLVTPI
jgi:hypothetical protein